MSRIHQVIDEITDLRHEPTHRSTLRIVNLMENNKKLFLEKMEADNYLLHLRNFSQLSQESPVQYQTAAYQHQYGRYFEALLFHINRIL